MKYTITLAFALLTLGASAQYPEGKVVYERSLQMIMAMANDNGEESRTPQKHIDKFELTYGNNQSLWKAAPPDVSEDGAGSWNAGSGGGNVQIRMFATGSDDITWFDFTNHRKVDLRELGTKKFVVDDSLRNLNWKLSDETKTILGHICRKAMAERISTRVSVNINNGKMEQQELPDTSQIVAWYATDIPVSAGPAEFQGQLPGLILELDINGGKQSYTAVAFSDRYKLSDIKEPKGGKRLTSAQFAAERKKLMEEMESNMGGGGRTIRIQN